MNPCETRPVLVADIGGTRARFALAVGGRVGAGTTLALADFATPLAAIRACLAAHGDPSLGGLVLALAAPVDGTPVTLTNAGWSFDRAELAVALALPVARIHLLNDFAALALALPMLSPAELRQVGGGLAVAAAPRLVLGPGTGLGVAGLVRGAAGWLAVPGEGGHATLAPGDDRESRLLELARREYGHVSAERLLCGGGLPLLHRLSGQVDGRPLGAPDTPAIVAAALAGDADCRATIDTFCGWLGSVAGNLALAFGARGGVYIGGGIVPRLGALFDRSPFRARFVAKGRFAAYLAAVPTHVILAEAPALRGAAAYAATCGEEAILDEQSSPIVGSGNHNYSNEVSP